MVFLSILRGFIIGIFERSILYFNLMKNYESFQEKHIESHKQKEIWQYLEYEIKILLRTLMWTEQHCSYGNCVHLYNIRYTHGHI